MLSRLKDQLEARYGEDWPEIEPETLFVDLGIQMNPLMLSQYNLLRTLGKRPDLFLEDANYFLRFVQAANNHYVDLKTPYIPNSLELAWGLEELKTLWPELEFNAMIETISHYILSEEGYSVAPPPFDFIKKPFENTWASEDDRNKKALAIRAYCRIMRGEFDGSHG